MKPLLPWLVLGLVAGCGGSPEHTTAATRTPPPDYELHEWGVITTSAAGTLVSAGPPRAPVPLIAVEKPVLYFHTNGPVSVQLEVLLGAGFDAVEHYPPTRGLHWSVDAMPGGCTAPHPYPTSCDTPDGLCEVSELATYEARDAACLQVGDARLPLLFYRLGATGPVSLPAVVEVNGDVVRARASRDEVSGWRVALVDGEVRSTPFTLGQTWHTLGTPDQPWTTAAESLNAALRAAGLTGAERAAFQRAWWGELFGAAPPSADATQAAETAAGAEEVEQPEEARPTEAEEVERMPRAAGPEVLDVMFYLLPPEEVNRVARLVATPTPNRVARAFLVRHVL